MKPVVYSWRSPRGVALTFLKVLFGGVAVVAYRHVWTLIARADLPKACKKINKFKGRKEDQTLGFLLCGKKVHPLVAWDYVAPHARWLYSMSPRRFARKFDVGRVFLRVPVTTQVPDHLKQGGLAHVVSVRGSDNWHAGLFQRLTDIFPLGVAISSLNRTGEASIIWTRDAVLWCQEMGVPSLLNFHRYDREPPLGSYPIVDFQQEGYPLVREGRGLDQYAVSAWWLTRRC